jgi:hypothetical protein
VQFLSLRSLAKSYFTGVGGQEISGKLKRRMPLTLGKRVEQGQLSLLNSWQLSEWSVGCSFTKRKRQLYNLELKLVSMVCCNQMSHDYCPYYLILVSNYFLHCDLISVSELIVVKKKNPIYLWCWIKCLNQHFQYHTIIPTHHIFNCQQVQIDTSHMSEPQLQS